MTAPVEESETRDRAAGKRRRGREMALQMLYQLDMGDTTVQQVLHHFDPTDMVLTEREIEAEESPESQPPATPVSLSMVKEAHEYARRLVEGTMERVDQLDGMIREQAENWRLERMSAVDRNVLRLAVFELAYEPDVPKRVVLDEGIELAKRFGSDQSSRFVNGILDGLLRKHHFAGRMT
jgi:N utilization substance protein B